MVFAVIIGIAASDIKAHATHGFENLGVVSGQVASRGEKIDISKIVAVQKTRQGDHVHSTTVQGHVEALDEEVMPGPSGGFVCKNLGGGRPYAGSSGHEQVGRLSPSVRRRTQGLVLHVQFEDSELYSWNVRW